MLVTWISYRSIHLLSYINSTSKSIHCVEPTLSSSTQYACNWSHINIIFPGAYFRRRAYFFYFAQGSIFCVLELVVKENAAAESISKQYYTTNNNAVPGNFAVYVCVSHEHFIVFGLFFYLLLLFIRRCPITNDQKQFDLWIPFTVVINSMPFHPFEKKVLHLLLIYQPSKCI